MMPSQPLYDADVLIIGGGLAGLTAGIHLAQAHLRVLLLEKQGYPHHKVCGEYISNEVLPYLSFLGVSVDELKPARIHRFLMSTVSGKTIESDLPVGGFGISRYTFDQFLANKACASGVDMQQVDVADVQFDNDAFTVTTANKQTYTARVVIGAYGKRSPLDRKLQRAFAGVASPWLAVKTHYQASFPTGLVALHNFDGGYCGLSQVEKCIVNACYLVNYQSFKAFKNVDTFQRHSMSKNPFLGEFFANAAPLYDKPLTISQVSFARKKPVENHVLMCGDTAGLIHPLCGNGMAMAIHSAKLASELIIKYIHGELSRSLLEKQYAAAWSAAFTNRLMAGRILQSVMTLPALTSVVIKSLQKAPALLPLIIRQTHGKSIVVNQPLWGRSDGSVGG